MFWNQRPWHGHVAPFNETFDATHSDTILTVHSCVEIDIGNDWSNLDSNPSINEKPQLVPVSENTILTNDITIL